MEKHQNNSKSSAKTKAQPSKHSRRRKKALLVLVIVIVVTFAVFIVLLLTGRVLFFNPYTRDIIIPNSKQPEGQTIIPQSEEENTEEVEEVQPDQRRDPVR